MYCKNCGTENPDKALFCKECGAKLNEEDTVEYATASNLPASSKKKQWIQRRFPCGGILDMKFCFLFR